MNFRSLLFVASFIGVVICSGQKSIEKQSRVRHLTEIPKRFEVRGDNAASEFKKYLSDIGNLAKEANLTVKYKVKVEVRKPQKKRKIKLNQLKTKKYRIPLKKNNMKLSNFEIIMRKNAETLPSRTHDDEEILPATTEKPPMVVTTKPIRIGKYKPILTNVRTNYTKVVKPVRNKIITLSV